MVVAINSSCLVDLLEAGAHRRLTLQWFRFGWNEGMALATVKGPASLYLRSCQFVSNGDVAFAQELSRRRECLGELNLQSTTMTTTAWNMFACRANTPHDTYVPDDSLSAIFHIPGITFHEFEHCFESQRRALMDAVGAGHLKALLLLNIHSVFDWDGFLLALTGSSCALEELCVHDVRLEQLSTLVHALMHAPLQRLILLSEVFLWGCFPMFVDAIVHSPTLQELVFATEHGPSSTPARTLAMGLQLSISSIRI